MGVLKLMPEALYQNITWRLEKLFLFLHSKKMSFFFFFFKNEETALFCNTHLDDITKTKLTAFSLIQ